MNKKKLYLKTPQIPVEVSNLINSGVIVCSHERSGTHFLMNSLSLSTHYTSNPYLDYESNPLGGIVQFHSRQSASLFFSQVTDIKANNGKYCISSLVKSHFPASLHVNHLGDHLKIIYIYRNPVDTLVSLWKFFWKYPHDGPCLESPFELAQATPCGNSQRYQICNYQTYFERWARHVSDAFLQITDNPNAYIISYSDLRENHQEMIVAMCKHLGISLIQAPSYPSKSLYWKGAEMTCPREEVEKLKDYCLQQLSSFKELPLDIIKD